MAESLLLHLHGDLLRALSTGIGAHITGLQQGARLAGRSGLIDKRMVKKLTLVDHAFTIVRHLTEPGCQQFLGELRTALATVPTLQPPQTTSLAAPSPSTAPAAMTPLDVFHNGDEHSHAGHATPFGGERPGHTPLWGSQAPATIATPAIVTSSAVPTLDIPGLLPGGGALERPPGAHPPGCPMWGLGGRRTQEPNLR